MNWGTATFISLCSFGLWGLFTKLSVIHIDSKSALIFQTLGDQWRYNSGLDEFQTRDGCQRHQLRCPDGCGLRDWLSFLFYRGQQGKNYYGRNVDRTLPLSDNYSGLLAIERSRKHQTMRGDWASIYSHFIDVDIS
jgi:hypothetical protein